MYNFNYFGILHKRTEHPTGLVNDGSYGGQAGRQREREAVY